MSKDVKTLNEIKEIGKKIEYSIGEYFYKSKLNKRIRINLYLKRN